MLFLLHALQAVESRVDWTDAKSRLQDWSGVHDDTLHVMAGLLILTLAAYAWRRPPWTLRPWLTVLAAECLNEFYDLTQTRFPSDEGNWADSLHDLWLTMLWPTLIWALYRRWGARSAADEVEQPLE